MYNRAKARVTLRFSQILKALVSFDLYYSIQKFFGFPLIHQRFYEKMGYKLNLKHTDSIMYAMLFNRDPQFPIITDKLRVRDFVEERLSSEVLVPLIDVVKTSKELKFDSYPDSFILKTNFMSGGNIFVHDKSTQNWNTICSKLDK